MLQRFVESFEHWRLIEEASKISNSAVRLAYITTFMYSYLPAVTSRLKKPFNPLLGETVEYIDDANGIRLIGEQVSHHPPISTIRLTGPSFCAYGDSHMKSSFTRSGLEIVPISALFVELKKTGEKFEIHKHNTKVKNVLWGTMYISCCGTMTIRNTKTNEVSVSEMAEVSPEDKKYSLVNSVIKDASGNVKVKLMGDWKNSSIQYQVVDTGETKEIFRPNPPFPHSEKMYGFGEFSLQLNYLNEEMAVAACPTDSRFRPDQRALEHGNLSVATEEKNRLEEKQRAKRKELETRGGHHVPRWFKETFDPVSNAKVYEYKGGYFEMRNSGKWTDIDDIY